MKFIILTLFIISVSALGADTCSRTAIINHQEVLIDTNSTEKGEGLRYHLEKDQKAEDFLNKYQDGARIKWQNVLLGTISTALLLGGVLTSDEGDKRKTFLVTGSSLMAVNFLIARTYQAKNENNLNKAIEEYNKRNLPKIYLGPKDSTSLARGIGTIFIAKSWSFK